MVETRRGDVTRILSTIGEGDGRAGEELLPLVYDELRKLAGQRMAHEQPGQTLQPTALVHEAYLRLVGNGQVEWNSRGHFFAAAAEAMRRILVDRARRHRRVRHGGGRNRIPANLEEIAAEQESLDLVDLDDALRRLEKEDARISRIVMLRFFAGLSVEDTAKALAVSPTTVKRDWAFARAWLYDEIRGRKDDG